MSTVGTDVRVPPSSGLKYRAAKCVIDGTVTRVALHKLLRWHFFTAQQIHVFSVCSVCTMCVQCVQCLLGVCLVCVVSVFRPVGRYHIISVKQRGRRGIALLFLNVDAT
jgi:hypothetical protein